MLVTKGVLTHPDQVTAEWLTRVLTRSGALADGEVAALAMEAQERNLSTSAHLRPGYSAESRGDRPDHLFLKMVTASIGSGNTSGCPCCSEA